MKFQDLHWVHFSIKVQRLGKYIVDIQILVKFAVNINITLQIVENSNKVLLTFRSPVKAHKFFYPLRVEVFPFIFPLSLSVGLQEFLQNNRFIIFRWNGFLTSNCGFFSLQFIMNGYDWPCKKQMTGRPSSNFSQLPVHCGIQLAVNLFILHVFSNHPPK